MVSVCLVAVLAVLSGCVSSAPTSSYAPTNPEQVKEADEKMVESCEFLGGVVGKSGWGGLAAGAARNGSMRSAKKRAAALGATHIVFSDFDNGNAYSVSTLEGRAYRCTDEP